MHTGKSQQLDGTRGSFVFTISDGGNFLTYQSVGDNKNSRLNKQKNEINLEMIEQFLFSLHPVTYRDWMQKERTK
ncbi:MAG: hypothetical protein B7Y56_01325 [Gallionellales bacterium 35-53-114]|jgi:hypothetical protein|nr:MAG: hypothetical protein B7Y56_01325 [Gallionellales bacterium 35-53-114]HQS57031.1 hypothetical protein [Gallionellaceae bacterium]HQS75185.1 hypothetical protein [Gallionellaceae bacterium]